MYDDKDQVIYVGKAKDLKKRLSSYFRKNLSSKKTEALVSSIHHIDTTITSSETEALLLEHNFIKLYQPRYNVLLRDDKSYPFILLTKERHPRITSYRGTKKITGEYFGPYPHAGAVRETLSLMQKYSLFVNVKIRFITIVPALVCNINRALLSTLCARLCD